MSSFTCHCRRNSWLLSQFSKIFLIRIPKNRVFVKVHLIINSCILIPDTLFHLRQLLNSVHTTAAPKHGGGCLEKLDSKLLSKMPKGPRTFCDLLVLGDYEKQEYTSEPYQKWCNWEMVGLHRHCSLERNHNSGEQPLRSACLAALQTCFLEGVCLFLVTINFQQDRKILKW